MTDALQPTKVVFNWSGGKDSAFALYKIMLSGGFDVSRLLTTFNEKYDRVSMHGVRSSLMAEQARQIGINLKSVWLPEMPDMPTYEKAMEDHLLQLGREGIRTAVFGDIFLEDLRKYREDKLAAIGMECLFPLWKMPTDVLIRDFIKQGFKAITVCVDEKYLDRSYAGRIVDEDFVRALPRNVDPCGENGEFHTFVYDGPIFSEPVRFVKGEIVHREYSRQPAGGRDSAVSNRADDPFDTGFWYCDLLPGTGA